MLEHFDRVLKHKHALIFAGGIATAVIGKKVLESDAVKDACTKGMASPEACTEVCSCEEISVSAGISLTLSDGAGRLAEKTKSRHTSTGNSASDFAYALFEV